MHGNSTERTEIRACSLSELPAYGQGGLRCDVGAYRLAVFRTDAGICAIDDQCPHEDESLAAGRVKGCVVACPVHKWTFDLKTGRSPHVRGASVAAYEVEVRDGEVFVIDSRPRPRAEPAVKRFWNRLVTRFCAKVARSQLHDWHD